MSVVGVREAPAYYVLGDIEDVSELMRGPLEAIMSHWAKYMYIFVEAELINTYYFKQPGKCA